MALSDSTLLGLAMIGGSFELAEFAARGVSMTMAPIDASGQVERDVNGNLVDLMEGFDQFKKYKFTISCDDMESPGFAAGLTVSDQVWIGTKFTLTCLPGLGATDPLTFTTMVTAPWQVTTDEWGAAVSWSLDLEQV
jgi:hypothetical protein